MKKINQLLYLILLIAATNGLTLKLNAMKTMKSDGQLSAKKTLSIISEALGASRNNTCSMTLEEMMNDVAAIEPKNEPTVDTELLPEEVILETAPQVITVEKSEQASSNTTLHMTLEEAWTCKPEMNDVPAMEQKKDQTSWFRKIGSKIASYFVTKTEQTPSNTTHRMTLEEMMNTVAAIEPKKDQTSWRGITGSKILIAAQIQIDADAIIKNLTTLSQEKKNKLNEDVRKEIVNRLIALTQRDHQSEYNEILKESQVINELRTILKNL